MALTIVLVFLSFSLGLLLGLFTGATRRDREEMDL